MSFPRYPKYKDSGVEWLGQVPGHREVKRPTKHNPRFLTKNTGRRKHPLEVPFNRHFCVFQPLRSLAEIDAEPEGGPDRIHTMIGGLTK